VNGGSTVIIFNILSFLLKTLSPTICKLFHVIRKKDFWLITKWFMHCFLQLIICELTTTYSILDRSYKGVSKILWTDAVKTINLTTKRMLKLPTSTQLHATWHTDSLDMAVLPSTGASHYQNCCIDGSTSPEYFGNTLVQKDTLTCSLTHSQSHTDRGGQLQSRSDN
jgi:hypothetical protein